MRKYEDHGEVSIAEKPAEVLFSSTPGGSPVLTAIARIEHREINRNIWERLLFYRARTVIVISKGAGVSSAQLTIPPLRFTPSPADPHPRTNGFFVRTVA